jgi:AraC-like DNA-binding protein
MIFGIGVESIDNIFYNILSQSNIKLNLVENCLNLISAKQDVKVSDLEQSTGYTIRWIEKIFIEYLGSTPGHLISISRLNKFIELLNYNKNQRLTNLALESGYYDQSHLIREMRKYTDDTPGKFKTNLDNFTRTMNHI